MINELKKIYKYYGANNIDISIHSLKELLKGN